MQLIDYILILIFAAFSSDIISRIITYFNERRLTYYEKKRLQKLKIINRKDLTAKQSKELQEIQNRLLFGNLVRTFFSLWIFTTLRNYIRDHFAIGTTIFIVWYMIVRIIITKANIVLLSQLMEFVEKINLKL